MMKQAVIFGTVVILAIIGFIDMLFRGWTEWIQVIIPLALVAIFIFFYKYPPKRYRRSPKVKPSARTAAKLSQQRRSASSYSSSQKRKSYPFQVIDGNKGKNDDTPKYH